MEEGVSLGDGKKLSVPGGPNHDTKPLSSNIAKDPATGNTLLMLSVIDNRLNLAERILELGADINERNYVSEKKKYFLFSPRASKLKVLMHIFPFPNIILAGQTF